MSTHGNPLSQSPVSSGGVFVAAVERRDPVDVDLLAAALVVIAQEMIAAGVPMPAHSV